MNITSPGCPGRESTLGNPLLISIPSPAPAKPKLLGGIVLSVPSVGPTIIRESIKKERHGGNGTISGWLLLGIVVPLC